MNLPSIGRSRAVKLAAVVAVSAVLAGGATALAQQPTTASQVSAGQPPNVTLVEQQVEAYYGDTVDAQGHHHPSENSAWGRQAAAAIADGQRYLTQKLRHAHQPAIVLDVDDTSEVTEGWEVDSQFAYDPASNEAAIDANQFPAITPTLKLAQYAAAHGVAVFFLTGRPEHQRAATVADLASDGYPTPKALFLKAEKGTPPPSYLSCGSTCTTDQYKSQTRAYIQSLGYDIVLNVGDQYSDLSYGHEDKAVKLPNPMYYLP
jgi:predicted secreted acid phosphatase